jgi:hypothetical protein
LVKAVIIIAGLGKHTMSLAVVVAFVVLVLIIAGVVAVITTPGSWWGAPWNYGGHHYALASFTIPPC